MKRLKRMMTLGLCMSVAAGSLLIPTRASAGEGDVVFTFGVADGFESHIQMAALGSEGAITPGTPNAVGFGFSVTVDGGSNPSIIEPNKTSDNGKFNSSDVSVICTTATSCSVTIQNLGSDGVRFSTPGDAGFALRYADGGAYSSTATNLTSNAQFEFYIPSDRPNTYTGQAYVAWKCAEHSGVCLSLLTIPPALDNVNQSTRNFAYFAASTVTDARTGEYFSNFNNEDERGFILTGSFTNWVEAYKTRNSVSSVDWSTVNIAELLYGTDTVDGAKIPPLGEPMGANSYVSYGEHAFNAIIYGDSYAALTAVNINALEYVPYGFAADPVELSGSTATAPAVLSMPLLDNRITIDSTGIGGFDITSIEVLDSNIPAQGVSITSDAGTGAFVINFGSNFFDNVVFKVTGANGQTYYLEVRRVTFTQMEFEHATMWNNNFTGIRGELIYKDTTSHSDYEVTVNVVYRDGTSTQYVAENLGYVDENYGGNLVFASEYSGAMSGTGLKRANFGVRFDDMDFDRDIDRVYFNVRYTGSTGDDYAGTFAGSGRGIVLKNLGRR